MSNSSKSSRCFAYSIRQKIGLFWGLFLFVLVLFVPPPSGMNPFAQRMGAVVLLMASATLANSYAFMMPVGTPPNAIVFGSGWVRVPQMAKAGFFLNLLGALVITLVVYFIAVPVFGINIGSDQEIGEIPLWAQ